MIQQKLVEKFGGIINHMSCIYLRQGEKHLRSFLEELKPLDTIIEIGTYQGVSACVLGEYARKVYSYDVTELPLRSEIISYLEKDNVDCYVGNPNEIATQIGRIFKHEKVDLCFIDGEHFNGELQRDFDVCESCKRILIHDYATNFREVWDFVNNLKGWKKDIRDTFVLLTKEEGQSGKQLRKKLDEQIEVIEKPKKKRGRKRKSTKE